jgi:hypothetical protein
MESFRLYLERVNTFIGASTFGRVFRLEGCGHVCFAILRQIRISLTSNAGQRDQKHTVHHRSSRRLDNVLYHGIRHIRQCES